MFSRFEGRFFRFEEDYFRLVEKSIAILGSGGILHAVTNFSGITAREFQAKLLDSGFRVGGREIQVIRLPLPVDFDISHDSEKRTEGNALIFQIFLK